MFPIRDLTSFAAIRTEADRMCHPRRYETGIFSAPCIPDFDKMQFQRLQKKMENARHNWVMSAPLQVSFSRDPLVDEIQKSMEIYKFSHTCQNCGKEFKSSSPLADSYCSFTCLKSYGLKSYGRWY